MVIRNAKEEREKRIASVGQNELNWLDSLKKKKKTQRKMNEFIANACYGGW